MGSYPANPFGLHEVLGNVMEWTQDCYHDGYAGAPANGGAWTTGEAWATGDYCGYRVVRGGTYYVDPVFIRSAGRFDLPPSFRNGDLGFRLARTFP
jgi:formylglycine-generating enzyme required for sulfatase activity